MQCESNCAILLSMRKFTASVFALCVLSGCASTGSLLETSSLPVSLSGSWAFAKNTVQNVQDAYTITVQSLTTVKNGIQQRVQKVQKGVGKLQEGKELIEEGVM